MAILANNVLVNGFSGMLGNTLVFKNLRGKTILSCKPRPPKKQSDHQKANRNKFKQASLWAKVILVADPEKKTYYQKMAKKLKLPNAYTAAITDYMRPVKVKEIKRRNGSVMYKVFKKDFRLKNAEVQARDKAGLLLKTQPSPSNTYSPSPFLLSEYPPNHL